MRWRNRLLKLPLATGVGAILSTLAALVCAVVAYVTSSRGLEPSVAGFALAPLPTVLGLWLDWARLYRPTRRTRRWSFAFLVLAVFGGLEAGFVADRAGASGLLLGAAVPLACATLAVLGGGLLIALSRRGRGVLGFGVVCGAIRREESDRILLDSDEGLVELRRGDSDELGSRRLVDLSNGAPLAVLARLAPIVPGADPFRTQARALARPILGVAASPSLLRATLSARARAWTAYLLALAIGGAALGWGVSDLGAQDAPCTVGCVTKTY